MCGCAAVATAYAPGAASTATSPTAATPTARRPVSSAGTSSATAPTAAATATTHRSSGCQSGTRPSSTAAQRRAGQPDRDAALPAAHTIPAPPQHRPRRTDQRADRRGQRDHVVAWKMPCMKLKTSAVTTSQPPHTTANARAVSVRGARPRAAHRDDDRSSAAGSSQAIWPPISAVNSRCDAGRATPSPAAAAATAAAASPVSLPLSRPSPL